MLRQAIHGGLPPGRVVAHSSVSLAKAGVQIQLRYWRPDALTLISTIWAPAFTGETDRGYGSRPAGFGDRN